MSMTSVSIIQGLLGGCDCPRLRQRSGEALANADESLHQSVHHGRQENKPNAVGGHGLLGANFVLIKPEEWVPVCDDLANGSPTKIKTREEEKPEDVRADCLIAVSISCHRVYWCLTMGRLMLLSQNTSVAMIADVIPYRATITNALNHPSPNRSLTVKAVSE